MYVRCVHTTGTVTVELAKSQPASTHLLGAALDDHVAKLGRERVGDLHLDELVRALLEVGAAHDRQVDLPPQVDLVRLALVSDRRRRICTNTNTNSVSALSSRTRSANSESNSSLDAPSMTCPAPPATVPSSAIIEASPSPSFSSAAASSSSSPRISFFSS